MSDTNINSYMNKWSQLIQCEILHPISEHLKSIGCNQSVDDLLNVLNLPRGKTQPSTPMAYQSSIPSMGFGGSQQTVQSSSGSTRKAQVSVAVSQPDQGRCKYKYKRGKNKDLYCNKETTDQNIYCDLCIKTRKLNGAPASAAPGVAPNFAGSSNENQEVRLSVVRYNDEKDLYRDTNHNFIVRKTESGIEVIAKLDMENDKFVELSESDRIVAQNLGIIVVEFDKNLEGDGTVTGNGNGNQDFNQKGYGQSKFQAPFSQPGFSQPGFSQPPFSQPAFSQQSFSQQSFSQPSFSQPQSIPSLPLMPSSSQSSMASIPSMPSIPLTQQSTQAIPSMPPIPSMPTNAFAGQDSGYFNGSTPFGSSKNGPPQIPTASLFNHPQIPLSE